MTCTAPLPDTATPGLDAVHHHCPEHYGAAALAGRAVPSLCGYVKVIDPEASDKPCCPLCGLALERRGRRCNPATPMVRHIRGGT